MRDSRDQQFQMLTGWDALPSPKIRRSDRVGPYSWNRLYTGFSEAFARAAIRLLASSRDSVVLDPFVGAGTSLIAGARLGHPVIGADLDPVSALFARAALASHAHSDRARCMLESAQQDHEGLQEDDSEALFAAEDTAFARRVFARIASAVGKTGASLLSAILNSDEWDTEAVTLASLMAAANNAASVVRGSNPVWYRRARPGEPIHRESLPASAAQWLSRILRDVNKLDLPKSRQSKVIVGDFRALDLPAHSVGAVLTSPPYLNRVDYVKNHLASLHLLSALMEVDLVKLRSGMMGTTRMVDKPAPDPDWGSTCLSILQAIESHDSKASASYYLPFFTQYFRDTWELIECLKVWCSPTAKAAVVVQTSYYKELLVPLAEIWIEMATLQGIEASQKRKEPVRQHLGTISPSQKTWVKEKVLTESVVLLSF